MTVRPNKNTWSNICCLQKVCFKFKDTNRLKLKGWKIIYHANSNGKKARMPVLTLDKNSLFFFFFFFLFLGVHLWQMEVSQLGVESKLQLLAYTTAIATWDPNCVFNLHHSSRQHWIPDPLSEARCRTCILMDTS